MGPRSREALPLTSTFAELGVRPETVDALAGLGITTPFPIQALTIPLGVSGHDLIGQARTGTGKTLAFGLTILERLPLPGAGRPLALVVVPTRELAVQVSDDLARTGSGTGARVLTLYGGRSYEPQVAALQRGVDVVVGTPGRLLDLARQGALDLGEVGVLVLDEADEMLDLGFLPDVERIIDLVPAERQTMLFSATMPAPVVTLARRYLRQPTHVRAEDPNATATVPTTAQHVLRAHALDKDEVLARILQAQGRGLTMVFCRTKRQCDKVAEELTNRGFAAAAVHGDLGQGARERALRAFRNGKVDVLVATDVAARGIDVKDVTHVVNYTCPEDEKIYLHRIGRTGRAGESGTAVTFVDWSDLPRWKMINDALALPFPEPPEIYSTSPELYEEFGIPAGVKGRLPRSERTRAGLEAEELEDLGETGRSRTSGRTSRSDAAPRNRTGAERGPRRRTRGGGRGADGASSAPTTPSESATAIAGPSTAETATSEPARRRRRRRRGPGTGATAGAGPADTAADSA